MHGTTTTASSPEQLIDAFKKSGEFDRLRRELLAQFQRSERTAGLQTRVCDIARQRLASDPALVHLSHDALYRELMGEIDRYPVLERAVAEAPLLSDPGFAETIRDSVQRVLEDCDPHERNLGSIGEELNHANKSKQVLDSR